MNTVREKSTGPTREERILGGLYHLAGVAYGVRAIPQEWRTALARAGDLEAEFGRFVERCA